MAINRSIGKTASDQDVYVDLDGLSSGCTSAIKVMVCRKWDVNNSFGKYRSTDYIVGDEKGNVIQCSVRSNISHCFISKLVEGNVYSMKNFSVVENKEKFRIRNSDPIMIELEGYSIVTKLSCPVELFNRFPFQLVPLEDIRVNDSIFLIDVIGYVIDVGSIRKTKTGTGLVDCHILNERGIGIRLTLWGSLSSNLIQSRDQNCSEAYIAIFTSMHIKEFRGLSPYLYEKMPKKCISYEKIEGWIEKIIAFDEVGQKRGRGTADWEDSNFESTPTSKRMKTVVCDPIKEANEFRQELFRMARIEKETKEMETYTRTAVEETTAKQTKGKGKMEYNAVNKTTKITVQTRNSKKRVEHKTSRHSLNEMSTVKQTCQTEKEPSTQKKDDDISILSETDSC